MSNTVLKPVFAVFLMVVLSKVAYSQVYMATGSNTVGCFVGIAVAVVVYGITLLLTGVIGRHELEIFPGGSKVAGAVSYTHLDVYKRQVLKCAHEDRIYLAELNKNATYEVG